jgi:hypothetical protein
LSRLVACAMLLAVVVACFLLLAIRDVFQVLNTNNKTVDEIFQMSEQLHCFLMLAIHCRAQSGMVYQHYDRFRPLQGSARCQEY